MRLQFFGTTKVDLNSSTDLVVTAPRQRAVLARLATSPGIAVPANVLLADVWGEDEPATGVKAVAYQITKLRDLLEPGRDGTGSVIATEGLGYRLLLDPEQVDLIRFEQLLSNARAASDGTTPNDTTLELLQDALELWTAEPYADLADMSWATNEQARLISLHYLARHSLIQEKMRRGLHRDVIGDLEVLVRQRPLEEGLVVDQMAALRQVGRIADALRCCSALRTRLAQELGIEPSALVQTVERELLQVRESGYENPAAPSGPSQNLAFPVDSFVGRARELAAVHELLDTHRLVTIAGTGGIGKTRLATHVGLDRTAAHPDGVWIVELAPVADDAQVLAAIATALGLHPGDRVTRLSRIERFLQGRNALLIVDNCEHLLSSCASTIDALLAAAPGLKILATSRESLGVAGEQVERLAPLGMSDVLLRHRATAVRAGFDDVDGADRLISVICDRLAGIPLAIELAAIQIRSMSLGELAERIEESKNFGRAKYGQPHHETLDAAIAWSVETLDDDARTVFRRMSVFAGGCDAAAIRAVCMPGQTSRVAQCLDQLVDKSLVETEPGPAGALRFGLLEPIRKFAAFEVQAAGESSAVVEAHAQHYLDMSFDLEGASRGNGQRAAVQRIATEAHNIVKARTTLHERLRLDDELDLCWNLFVGWRAGLTQQLGTESILAALDDSECEDAPERDPFRVARAWYECAHLALDISMPASVEYAQNGIEIARSLKDDNLLGRLLICQACAIQNATDRSDGLAIFAEGERLFTENPGPSWWNDEWETAWFDMIRAAFGPRHDLTQNRRLTIRSAEAFGALGDQVHHVLALMVSAFWGIGTEHQDFVESSLERGLDSARRNRLGAMTGHVALYQAFVAIASGDTARTGALLAEAQSHLGDLPPEVAAMIDPTIEPSAASAASAESGRSSLAATVAGSASAIAPTHGETAKQLRHWANTTSSDPAHDLDRLTANGQQA